MKTLLTCDEVFETLTAAPVVNESKCGEAIRDHVADCEACARLAEAFKPATHLIHEAMPLELRRELPVYLADEETASSIMSLIDALPHDKQTNDTKHERRLFRAVFSLGAVAAIILLLLWRQLPAENGAIAGAGMLQLDRQNLPMACVDSQSPTVHASHQGDARRSSGSVYVCCTTCHASSNDARPRINDLARLVASCSICH